MRLPKHPLWNQRCVFFAEDGDGGGGGEHWSDSYDDITSNADVHAFAKRYHSEADLAKAGYEARQKLGSSYRLPDDLSVLTQDQKAELITRVRSLKSVPDKPESYEITRPSDWPKQLTYDENFESAMRQFAHQRGWENAEVQEVCDFFNQGVLAAHNRLEEAQAKTTSRAEEEFRLAVGGKYNQVMRGISAVLKEATNELGLNYQDEETGEMRSKLDDCLDVIRTAKPEGGDEIKITQLGNKVPILQLLSWIHDKFLGSPELVGGSGSAMSEWDFYKKVDS